MQNFEYCTPTKMIFGKGVVEKLPEVLATIGTKVLMTYGGGSIKRSGLYDTVKKLLADKFDVTELSGIEPNPKYSSVLEGIRLCRENNIEVILAVGGGSVLDCSKAIAGCTLSEGDPWDIITSKVPTTNALPVVDIITMAATGSEYDFGGVISRPETNDKVGYMNEHLFPKCSLIDPTYTFTVPKNQTVAGVADAMNHILETYFNSDPNFLMDGIMETAIKSLIKNVRIVLDEPENYDARAEIFLNCSLACNGIYGLGEAPSGWPMHGIEHALSAYYDITHGVGLAIITPRWLKHIMNEKTVGRIAQYGRNVFGINEKSDIETAEKAISATYDLYESIGIPMHLREVGIDESRISEMAHHIAVNEGLNQPYVYAPLNEKDIEEILMASL
ncbi:MAG: iron-containing alcohol dehydrogenase [Ruminococcus sp.]|nr:iron-containing alcohol dehydrogenase [Ruminococcus sp.]